MSGKFNQALVHYDCRSPIAMWPLLIWAYRRQMVHHAARVDDDCSGEPYTGPRGYVSSWNFGTLEELGILSRGGRSGAGSAGRVHPDAYVVDGCVSLLKPDDARLIKETADKACPPVWDPVIPPHRIVPVRKGGTGRIRMIYRQNRPVACMVTEQGVPDEEADAIREAARADYTHWWKLLSRLRVSLQFRDNMLTRWKITEIGIPKQPW